MTAGSLARQRCQMRVGITKMSAQSCLCRCRHNHDLRHSLAVSTLLEWYRSGEDIDAEMPALSGYLGHVRPEGTYWYISATPELMQLAAARAAGKEGRDE
jgi:integrase